VRVLQEFDGDGDAGLLLGALPNTVVMGSKEGLVFFERVFFKDFIMLLHLVILAG